VNKGVPLWHTAGVSHRDPLEEIEKKLILTKTEQKQRLDELYSFDSDIPATISPRPIIFHLSF
jgi:hypothetical protein